ncbi:MAG TPA: hypothetical protein VGL50_03165 [Steroidobacteraceae bacterium]
MTKAKPQLPTPAFIAALAAALMLLVAVSARAETIAVDDQVSVRPSDIARPDKGMTMKSVEAKFGAPQDRHEAVGNPPITRWDYPLFTVYFEHEYVIHAVVNPGT